MWMAFGGALGLVAGSFLATLIMRWPAGTTLAGRSRCPSCGAQLSAASLVPVLSWLAQRGRAQCCGARIPLLYPATELAGAAIGALAFALAPWPAGFAGAILGWTLLPLVVLDWKSHWLPDRLTLPLLALGLALGAASPASRVLGAALGGGGLFLVAVLYRRWKGRIGLGRGDIKLAAALGAWLGTGALPVLLATACAIGLAFALAAALNGKALTLTTKVPFGAALAIAGFAIWCAGMAFDA